MSTKKPSKEKHNNSTAEITVSTQWRDLCRAFGKFRKEWDSTDSCNERSRVVGAVIGVRIKSDAGDPVIRECHRAATNLVSCYEEFEDPFNVPSDDPLHEVVKYYESYIGQCLISILTGPNPKSRLMRLARLNSDFPITKGSAPSFAYYPERFDEFAPTLQHGTKAVLLRVFLDLWNSYGASSLPFAMLRLPTIKELDSAIREKWKWSGGDKELRDARRDLGLSGLPRGKSGRPKKQRGKK